MKRCATLIWADIKKHAARMKRRSDLLQVRAFFYAGRLISKLWKTILGLVVARHKDAANTCFVMILTCPRLLWNGLWVTWE